ncbi:hypothetical protein [Streptomyces sp. NPDC055085]
MNDTEIAQEAAETAHHAAVRARRLTVAAHQAEEEEQAAYDRLQTVLVELAPAG